MTLTKHQLIGLKYLIFMLKQDNSICLSSLSINLVCVSSNKKPFPQGKINTLLKITKRQFGITLIFVILTVEFDVTVKIDILRNIIITNMPLLFKKFGKMGGSLNKKQVEPELIKSELKIV